MKTNIINHYPQRSNLLLTHLELLGVITIWAGTFVATKIVLSEITPAFSALLRYIIASLILLVVNHRNRERVDRADYRSFFLLGLTGVTLYYLLQHFGIKYTNATDAAILISLSPIFIGLISWFLLKERLKLITGIGLGIALTGAVLVISNGKSIWDQPGGRIQGDLLILLTAVSWAIYSVYGKKLLSKYHPKTLITYTTLIGTVLLIPFSLPELNQIDLRQLSWGGWLNLLYLGGAASVYGYLAWYRALKKLPAITVGSYLYFRPLLTGIIAVIVLHETLSLFILAGGILILFGTYLAVKS